MDAGADVHNENEPKTSKCRDVGESRQGARSVRTYCLILRDKKRRGSSAPFKLSAWLDRSDIHSISKIGIAE